MHLSNQKLKSVWSFKYVRTQNKRDVKLYRFINELLFTEYFSGSVSENYFSNYIYNWVELDKIVDVMHRIKSPRAYYEELIIGNN